MDSLIETPRHLRFPPPVTPPRVSDEPKRSAPLLLRFFPCLTDLAFLLPIVALITLFQGPKRLLADGDTGWHIRTGDWILQNRSLPYRDLFSFTMPDRSWVAWEWGWDVVFSVIHTHWSLSGVVWVNTFFLGVIGVLIYRLVRRHAPNDVVAFIIAGMVIFVSSLHWLARPHLASWIFILVFLHAIDRAERGETKLLWVLPSVTVLWANVHASFFVGILFLLTYAAGNTAQSVLSRGRQGSVSAALRTGFPYLLSAVLCLLASLVNPYGWHLHEHVFAFLSDSKQLKTIQEYAPISFSSSLILEVLLGSVIFYAFRCFGTKQWGAALTLLLWTHLAMQTGRNVPIFAFIAAPFLAELAGDLLNKLHRQASAGWQRRATATLCSLGQDFRAFERVERLPLVPFAAMAFLAAGWGMLPGGHPVLKEFDRKDFPVAAVAAMGADSSRIFTFDQWGDYLIYKQFPLRRAFVDGRADFYGASFGDDWVHALNGKDGWKSELTRYGIDTVLVKTGAPLSSILKESQDWKTSYDDGIAIVFRRVSGRR